MYKIELSRLALCRQFAGKHLAELGQLEREARLSNKGLWQGTFEVPENWRRKKQKNRVS